MTGHSDMLATDLPALPICAGQARRFVTDALLQWRLQDVADETILLTSEVVTNALLHSGTATIHLRLVLLEDGIRIEVGDESPISPQPRHYSQESGTGRGLALVAMAARSWGSEPTPSGKTVWFEIGTA